MNFSSAITGPRWAGIDDFLYTQAQKLGLSITVNAVSAGFFRKKYFFKITGEPEIIEKMRRRIIQAAQNY
jgi:hypothetical protein